jgi:hypothetical protein
MEGGSGWSKSGGRRGRGWTGSGCRARGGGGETLGQRDLGEVECLRRMPVRSAGGSGDAGKKKGERQARAGGLASEQAKENKAMWSC